MIYVKVRISNLIALTPSAHLATRKGLGGVHGMVRDVELGLEIGATMPAGLATARSAFANTRAPVSRDSYLLGALN